MKTPYWSDFVPNSTFYRILSGFHRTFATGVACRQGTLTPPDTWSRPFGTCICSTCWDQSFSELVVILPDYVLRISLGTFSILLCALLTKVLFETSFKSFQYNTKDRCIKLVNLIDCMFTLSFKVEGLYQNNNHGFHQEKKEETWLSPMSKAPTPTEKYTKGGHFCAA